MNSYPHLSEDELLSQVMAQRSALTAPNGKWPQWMRGDPEDLLSDKKFVVCGSQCHAEIRVLARHANVIAVVDDVVAQQAGASVLGIDVIDTDGWVELARNEPDVVSVMLVGGAAGHLHFHRVAMQWELQVLSSLQFLQLLTACRIDRTGEVGRFFWYGEEFFDRTLLHLDRLVELRKHFGDPWSRISWLYLLLYRLTLNPFHLTASAVGHNYAKFSLDSYSINRRFFRFSDDEVYVDGGAFTGDTIGQFVRAVGGKFRRIHSFEPSAENNAAIVAMLSGLEAGYVDRLLPRVCLHQQGLWDRETTLLFNPCHAVEAGGTADVVHSPIAHIVDAGLIEHIYDKQRENAYAIRVPVTTIDAATDRQGTFIKLEIEGSELQALRGARETIARNRPKMAISIYHKPEDLETLLEFVLETDQDYRLGFRLHNPLVPDAAVLYCW